MKTQLASLCVNMQIAKSNRLIVKTAGQLSLLGRK